MILLLIYVGLPILYLMPVMQQTFGRWVEVGASVWFLPASLISFLLIYTWFNRIPESGSLLRAFWRSGRSILIAAYLWSLGVLLWINYPILFRQEHRDFYLILVLAAVDIAAILYLLLAKYARKFFSEFPEPVDFQTQQNVVKEKALAREQFAREARLSAPVARTADQQAVEAHWRAEALKEPDAALPWLELGVLAYQCGKGAQALALMEKALQCDADNPIVLRNLCELYRQQRQLTRAAELGVRAVELAPADTVARLNLAQVYVDDKKFDEAMNQYHRVLELEPKHVQTWLNMAILLLQQERRTDALAALDAVLLIDPESERAKDFKRSLQA